MKPDEIDVYGLEYPDVCTRIKAALERWQRFDQRDRRQKDEQPRASAS